MRPNNLLFTLRANAYPRRRGCENSDCSQINVEYLRILRLQFSLFLINFAKSDRKGSFMDRMFLKIYLTWSKKKLKKIWFIEWRNNSVVIVFLPTVVYERLPARGLHLTWVPWQGMPRQSSNKTSASETGQVFVSTPVVIKNALAKIKKKRKHWRHDSNKL